MAQNDQALIASALRSRYHLGTAKLCALAGDNAEAQRLASLQLALSIDRTDAR